MCLTENYFLIEFYQFLALDKIFSGRRPHMKKMKNLSVFALLLYGCGSFPEPDFSCA